MPKPTLTDKQSSLEHECIKTMQAGLKVWRPDLNYPESYSDWQACFRGLLKMFHIERRPLAIPLQLECGTCEGLGHLIGALDQSERPGRSITTCPECKGRRYLESE